MKKLIIAGNAPSLKAEEQPNSVISIRTKTP